MALAPMFGLTYHSTIAVSHGENDQRKWILNLGMLSQMGFWAGNRVEERGWGGLVTEKISEKVWIMILKHLSKSQDDWMSYIDVTWI